MSDEQEAKHNFHGRELSKDAQELAERVFADAKKATPDSVLETQITDSRIAKNEREHWAARRIAELEAELDRLRYALVRIDDASNHYAMTPTYSEGSLRYAHKSTRNLARAALQQSEGK